MFDQSTLLLSKLISVKELLLLMLKYIFGTIHSSFFSINVNLISGKIKSGIK